MIVTIEIIRMIMTIKMMIMLIMMMMMMVEEVMMTVRHLWKISDEMHCRCHICSNIIYTNINRNTNQEYKYTLRIRTQAQTQIQTLQLMTVENVLGCYEIRCITKLHSGFIFLNWLTMTYFQNVLKLADNRKGSNW